MAKIDPTYDLDQGTAWPKCRVGHLLWDDASEHIKTCTGSNTRIECGKVRARVTQNLSKRFETLQGGEMFFGLTLENIFQEETSCKKSSVKRSIGTQTDIYSDFDKEISKEPKKSNQVLFGDVSSLSSTVLVSFILTVLGQLNDSDLDNLGSKIYSDSAQRKGVNNVANFFGLSIDAMKYLRSVDIPNLVYKFAYCLATKRPNSMDPLLRPNHMPFGLIQYQIEFFSCTNTNQVRTQSMLKNA